MVSSRNKRGQTVLDLLFVVIVLLVVGIVSVVSFKILSDVNTDLQADASIAPVAKNDIGNLTTNFPEFMDNSFVLLMALLWVSLIVTSFLVDSHPIFFILTVVLLVFVFIVAMILSNTYTEVTGDPDLEDASSSFPLTGWVFDHFLQIVIAMGFSSALALYAKARL